MEADWHDKQRQDGLLATSVIMITMAAIFVVLRCVSRFILIKNPGPDDCFIIIAMLFTIGYLINILILRENHIGFPVQYLTPDNMVVFIKVTLAIQVMYYVNICCIKTSILFTYLRFAVTNTFRMLCLGTIVLHAVFFLVCLVVTLAQCKPLHKMWDITGTVEGECINTTAFFYTTSAFNILTDIWILVLPIRTLRSINRPTREKYALFLIFGVGTFAAVASIVRLHTIYTYTLAEDPFRDGILVNQWSVIEVTIAISCASVSALKPIFSSRQRRETRRAVVMNSSYGYGWSGTWRKVAGDSNGTRGGGKDDAAGGGEIGLQGQNEQQKQPQQQQQPWHVKMMASRDYYPAGREEVGADQVEEKSKGELRQQAVGTSDGVSTSDLDHSPSSERAQVQVVNMGFHLPRPRMGAAQVVHGQGLPMGSGIPEPEPVLMRSQTGTSTDTSDSMILFSSSSSPRLDHMRAPGTAAVEEASGLSTSSGSFLVLQK